ncbi:IFNL3 protein, partial [Serilophus lunatus]|nr:IFNL3 protein [Serilophus lunatus]
LLVLVLGVILGGALPQHGPRRGCSLFKYKQLVLRDRRAVNKMLEDFSRIRRPGLHCKIQLFDRKWRSAQLSVPDRVVLVEAELNFTLTMLQFPSRPSFAETHQEPLAFLAQAWEDLRGCVSPSHQPSGKLRHWLQKLQVTVKTETTPCLEDYAIRHIFEVLEDLVCAALQEKC